MIGEPYDSGIGHAADFGVHLQNAGCRALVGGLRNIDVGLVLHLELPGSLAIQELACTSGLRTGRANGDEAKKEEGPIERSGSVRGTATQAEIGFVYSAQALQARALQHQQRSLSRNAIGWMEKALPVFQRRKEQGRLKGTELATSDSHREQMEKCRGCWRI